MGDDETRKVVRDTYGKIATARQSSCCCAPGGGECAPSADDISKIMGYSQEELASLPDGANLGVGCGNPVAHASLKEGETFLDLGSGGGIDCFLAAKKVGETGRAIGVDMTPEMLEKARASAEKAGVKNVEFRLGEIEHLPVADNSVDIITSNCVINLSPDKPAVFGEAFRVLKPGGRVMISDMVLLGEIPKKVRASAAAYTGCIAGAMLKDEYLELVQAAGFTDVVIHEETSVPTMTWLDKPTVEPIMEDLGITREEAEGLGELVVSLKFSAVKPAPCSCCGPGGTC